jgi:DNA-binding SARP family transcriptional activator/tetratricopeptide (TPR) repeat protein
MQLVRVLGPAAVVGDDGFELDLGARRHAEVLAVLAAHHGRQVSAETLADLVWRGEPPPSAATTLQGYVSRLRRMLEPDRPAGAPPTSIVTVGDGYRLALPTDVARFEADVKAARELIGTAPARAATLLERALAAWRGPAYAEVRDLDAVRPEVQRVEELRVVAREAHAQALLAAGGDAEVVPDLRRLVGEHPLRERGPALLATALYRSGRQADALAVLRDLRERLVEELGVDPGPDVVALEKRLLNQDPALLTGREHAPARRNGFAGRRAEFAALRRAWDRARSGVTSTVVVRGEAGIGKTRLVEEALQGTPARWGRCPAAPGAPAYWPWAQILGGLPAVDAAMEAGRFAFGLHLAEHLRGSTAAAVVLDDAHWADPDSLVVLEIALDALGDAPLLLILTARDDPPRAAAELQRVLAGMARRRDHLDLRLAGLTRDETGELLAGHAFAPETVAALAARTGGNPYFLGTLAELGAAAALPGDVRDTVRARVAALPAGGGDLMAALALAGRDLPVTVAAAATGRSPEAIEDALAAALRAGLVEEPVAGRLRVGHDLVREAVTADIGPVQRIALHTRLADSLTERSAVAEHRLAAAPDGPDERAAAAALDAAREALDQAALDDAAAWARRGVGKAVADDTRADLHRVAGIAARRAGRPEDSEAELRKEAGIARRRGDWARFAEAALESAPGGIGGYWALFGMLLGPSALLQEALTQLDAMPAPLRARLLAAEATQRTGTDRPGAAELAERALAEAGGDRDARARALVAAIQADWTPGTAPRRLTMVEELLALSAHDVGLEATAVHLHRCVLLELGRLAESAKAARRFAAIADRAQDPDLGLLDTWWRAGMQLMRGELAAALETAGSAALTSPAAAALGVISRSTVEGIAAWHAGRLIDAVGDATDLAAGTDPAFLLVVALGHAEAGHRDVALPIIDRLLAEPPEGQRRTPWAIMLSAALIALRDAERLAPLLPVLRSYGRQNVVLWPGVVILGPAQLYLGGALAVLGEAEEARRVLAAALEQADALGAEPFAERARTYLTS